MDDKSIIPLTAQIAAAFVSRNAIAHTGVAELIGTIHTALSAIGADPEAATPERPAPAVPVRQSIKPDFIVCLEDGRKLKTLKRYLRTQYGMSPDDYRQRWGLPSDYPMVAPSYAERRSQLAKASGLGRVTRRGLSV